MKLDEVDLIIGILAVVIVGAVIAGTFVFDYYCKTFGTPLTIIIGLGTLTFMVLVGYVDYLIEKYSKHGTSTNKKDR